VHAVCTVLDFFISLTWVITVISVLMTILMFIH